MNVDRVELAIDERLGELRAELFALTDCETCLRVGATMARAAYARGLTDALTDRRRSRAFLADLGYDATGARLHD